MGSISAAELDAWLRAGGTLVTASERTGRAVSAAFHRARRAEGLGAWPSPKVLDWNTFVTQAWSERASDGRLLLNALQEEVLWSSILAESPYAFGWLPVARRRLAQLAMEAHRLLSFYAPHLLDASYRVGWQQDAAAFSGWLTTFDQVCRSGSLLSPARLLLELLPLLERDQAARASLVLAGFDRLTPTQQRVFEAWGEWREIAPGETAGTIRAYAAASHEAELDACALWCSQRLAANQATRILVITQEATQRRGEIERAFLRRIGTATPLSFEFSLGVPLGQIGLVRSATLLLRWLGDPLDEHEVDWLLGSGTAGIEPDESAALQSFMRELRQAGRQRTHWTLDAFLRQRGRSAQPPGSWVQRMNHARRRLQACRESQTPLEWAELVPLLLKAIGWPGLRLTSSEFQAVSRWEQVVNLCGSLGFDGRTMTWAEFRSRLDRTLGETLFAEESRDAPIQIAGPAESAGLTADAVWFLSASEDAWPASGSTHPLLPIEIQRAARMPHATPQMDWDLAQSITARLLGAAPEVFFCCAQLKEGIETRPSRLVEDIAGTARPLPAELICPAAPAPLAIQFVDRDRIAVNFGHINPPAPRPFRASPQLSLFDEAAVPAASTRTYEAPGGAAVLTAQSQCAFRAFATARLGAHDWEPAQAGLSPRQRGQLLHDVLHAVWGGPTTNGIRTLTELKGLGANLRTFVQDHVQRVMAGPMLSAARELMPARLLELEDQRLTNLVTAWLDYERTRVGFSVDSTEVSKDIAIGELALSLRLDRVDRLSDGSLLVIDYKTGNVSPASWELPRPDDVQLPLYAAFALDHGAESGGLVFAKIRPGDLCFAGKVRDATRMLDPSLKSHSSLVKDALKPRHLSDWKAEIERLAREFLDGRADVDPRDYPATCKHCHLEALCRVRERLDETETEDDECEEVGDE